MEALSQWPPPERWLDKDKYNIALTFGVSLTPNVRRQRFNSVASQVVDPSLWTFYVPDNDVECYGALMSCSSHYQYVSEKENLERLSEETNMAWTELEFVEPKAQLKDPPEKEMDTKKNNEKKSAGSSKSKVQAVLKSGGGKKKNYSAAQQKKWDAEREEVRKERERHLQRYQWRLEEEPGFAEAEAARKEKQKKWLQEEREKKKKSDENLELFPLLFPLGEHPPLTTLLEEHRLYFGTRYMLIDTYTFADSDPFGSGVRVVRKKDLYMRNDEGKYVPRPPCMIWHAGVHRFGNREPLPGTNILKNFAASYPFMKPT